MKSEKAKKEKGKSEKASGALVNREDLLSALEQVTPGLSRLEIVEQATYFVFSRGRVITYNEEVACSAKSGLPRDFTGAIPSKKFLEMLRKFPDEQITVSFSDNEVVIRGARKRAHNVMSGAVLLPIDLVKTPDAWEKLNPDFTDAVGIVQECATKDLSDVFQLTCIHVTPKWIEAFDNHQIARYRIKTGMSEPFLLKRDGVRHLMKYEFVQFALSDRWLHLRTAEDTVVSLFRFVEQAGDYQDLTDIVKTEGAPLTLPKSLSHVAERANVYSSEDGDNNQVLVEMAKNEMRITGRGTSGRYYETVKIKYAGPDLKFQIAPGLLGEILKRDPQCQIADYKLKVDGGKFVYVACLEKV